MSIEISSNSETPEQIAAIISSKAESAKDIKATSESSEEAEAESQDESNEESDTSEKDVNDSETEESEDSDENQDEQKDEKPKKGKNLNKRFAKITAEKALLKQEAAAARLENERLREELQRSKNPEPKEIKTSEGKPQTKDFDSHEEYLDALTDWKIEQKDKAKAASDAQEKSKSAYQAQLDSHTERVKKFQEKTPEYTEVVKEFLEDHGNLKFSLGLEESIMTSDLGPEIFYELVKNPAELTRINSLSLVKQGIEIGKIEARLSKSNQTKTEIKKTKAPAPISPVGGTGSAKYAKALNDPSIDFAEYERQRLQQRNRK